MFPLPNVADNVCGLSRYVFLERFYFFFYDQAVLLLVWTFARGPQVVREYFPF